MTEFIKPKDIQINNSVVVINWEDGHKSIYGARDLRLRCPCAQCIDEWTGEARLDQNTVPSQVEAVEHMLVGNYAVQFLWSDVHYTGIYTFEVLRALCMCELCASACQSS